MNTDQHAAQLVPSAVAEAFPTPTPGQLATLHHTLTTRAQTEDLLDVTYRIVDSPVGELLVAATVLGIVRIAFDCENHDAVLDDLAAAVSPRILASGLRTDHLARQLEEYFDRRRRTFDLDLDLRLVDGFRRTVISHLPDIAYGATATYAAVAAAAGSPRAVRAVGTACAHNPLPVVIPCHRVVRRDGSIGQYLGGRATKAALLDMEAEA